MLHWFKTKPLTLIGIDISSSAVKVLELSKTDGQYRVESYGVAPLPANAVVERDFKDHEAIANAIKQVLKRASVQSKYAAVAVADSSVITRTIQVDAALTDNDLEERIQQEAEKYIPYPVNEVSLDFEVLGPSEKKPQYQDVLLVASHTKNVDSRVAALSAAGLTVKVVDVESYALERACALIMSQLPKHETLHTYAVMDIGAMITNLTIIHNNATVFNRSDVFGGLQLTKEIQRRYGLTYAEAGLAKKQGGLPDDYVSEVLIPFKESIVVQIRRALQFFFSSTGQNLEIQHILLAGGTAALPDLAEFVAQQIEIPTTVANPFVDMALSPRVNAPALIKDAPALMISCGLALRSFK